MPIYSVFLLPLKSELVGDEPYFINLPAFRSDPVSGGKTGRPFSREILHTFSGYSWSAEKLIQNLEKVGFVDIALLPAIFPDNVLETEKKLIDNLEEPFLLLGAEKPA